MNSPTQKVIPSCHSPCLLLSNSNWHLQPSFKVTETIEELRAHLRGSEGYGCAESHIQH